MLKVFTSIFLILSISTIAAAQDEYIFKAKGKFAKELKSLMEKYSKEGKIEIQEVPAESGLRQNATNIIDAFLNNKETNGDIAYGKRLYDARCATCHGANASQKKYNNSRVLSNLDKKTLVDELENYNTDPDFGGSTKFIMNQAVSGLVTDQLVSISAYIYSIKHSTKKTTTPAKKGQSSKETTSETSSYLQ